MRMVGLATAVAAIVATASADAAAPAKKPPYFGSISAARARMRTGPGRNFPASWLYVRAGLPVRVIDTFKEWRKVEDPGGTQGWMLGNLISETRTAIVLGDAPVTLRERPVGQKVLWRAQPGVVGHVGQCVNGWCRLDVHGRAGFLEASRLWGIAPDEVLP